MKYYIQSTCVALLAVVLLQPVPAQAQSQEYLQNMLATIQALTEQVSMLQARLLEIRAEMRDEVSEVVSVGLSYGTSSEQVSRLQTLLATDPNIYPEAYVTGYFGELTQQALQRLQERHGLEVTGMVDEETAELLNQYFAERSGGDMPAGLLQTPGIVAEIEDLVCERTQHTLSICPVIEEEDDVDEMEESESVEESEEEVTEPESAADGEEILSLIGVAGGGIDGAEEALRSLITVITQAPYSTAIEEARQHAEYAQSRFQTALSRYQLARRDAAYDAVEQAYESAMKAVDGLPDTVRDTEMGREVVAYFEGLRSAVEGDSTENGEAEDETEEEEVNEAD